MRVAIADDVALWRRGIVSLLTALGIEVTGEASDGDAILAIVDRDPPDVVILDIRMPPGESGGIDTAHRIRERYPTIGILALSQYSEASYASALLENGAHGIGYRLKDRVADADELRETLERLANGEAVIEPEIVERLVSRQTQRSEHGLLEELTKSEHEILTLIAEGRSNSGIAKQLVMSPKTVENHITAIFRKLNLASGDKRHDRRVQAVLAYLSSVPPSAAKPPE